MLFVSTFRSLILLSSSVLFNLFTDLNKSRSVIVMDPSPAPDNSLDPPKPVKKKQRRYLLGSGHCDGYGTRPSERY